MGKKSKSYPAYSGGSVVVNGKTVATSSRNGNNISTSYDMSDYEKNMFDSIQKGMSSGVSNLFEISDNERKMWQNQLNSLQNQGIEKINDIYTPMENNLKNDIASRFGNFDNSVFLDKLNAITNNKAKAVAELSNNLVANQNNLYTQELENRMKTLSFLDGLNSSLNNNIINYMNTAASNSNAGNTYNNNAYNASLKSSSFLDQLLGNASTLAGITSKFI